MSYTTTHLAALREAIATGTLTVTYDGKTVTYRSLSDLLRIVALMERALGQGGAARAVYPEFTRCGR